MVSFFWCECAGIPVLGWSPEWSSEAEVQGASQPLGPAQQTGILVLHFARNRSLDESSNLGKCSYFLENKIPWAFPTPTQITQFLGAFFPPGDRDD